MNECMCGVYNPNIYSYFLICGIPPKKMDQVNVYVAGFASRVHFSFVILVNLFMHGVAQNKEVKKRRKI